MLRVIKNEITPSEIRTFVLSIHECTPPLSTYYFNHFVFHPTDFEMWRIDENVLGAIIHFLPLIISIKLTSIDAPCSLIVEAISKLNQRNCVKRMTLVFLINKILRDLTLFFIF